MLWEVKSEIGRDQSRFHVQTPIKNPPSTDMEGHGVIKKDEATRREGTA